MVRPDMPRRLRAFLPARPSPAYCVAIAILACAVGGLPSSSAQPLRVGVRAGPTFGFLNDGVVPFVGTGAARANTNVRLDLHAGPYAIVPLGGPFGLQTELLYVRKGGHFSRLRDQIYRVERYRLAYLQGHVLARREVSLPGPLHLHVLGGLTGARLLGGTAQRAIHGEARVFRETIALAAQDLVRDWDVGALVGVGLGYPTGPDGRVTLSLRYNPGFRSVFTDRARPAADREGPFGDPPPLSRTPPVLRHDVITASFSYTTSLGR